MATRNLGPGGDAGDAGDAGGVPQPGADKSEAPQPGTSADGQQPHTPNESTLTQQQKDKEYDDRIEKLEELLKEYKAAKAAKGRSSSRSTTRSSRHSSGSTNRSKSSQKSTKTTTPKSPPRRTSQSSVKSPTSKTVRRRERSRSHRPHKDRSTSRRKRRASRSRSRTRTRSRSRSRSRSHSRSRSRSRSRRRAGHRRRSSHRSRRSASRSRSSSRHGRRRRTKSSRRSPKHKKNTDIEQALEDQYPTMGAEQGEPLPVSGVTLEPYYNLPPDLRSKARSRRSRRDMTFPEYMCGFLFMVSKSAPPNSELHAAINHAAQVAQDAAGYTWPAVREWSQSCLSHIQDRSEKWVLDSKIFARDRTRLSWLKGKPHHEVKIPCHAHNADKCVERATHYSEGKTWVHGCAVCMYGGDEQMSQSAQTHTVRSCRRKGNLKYSHDEGRNDYRRKGYQPQGRRDYKPEQNKPKN